LRPKVRYVVDRLLELGRNGLLDSDFGEHR
jgi:hypothetical protein